MATATAREGHGADLTNIRDELVGLREMVADRGPLSPHRGRDRQRRLYRLQPHPDLRRTWDFGWASWKLWHAQISTVALVVAHWEMEAIAFFSERFSQANIGVQ